MLIITEAKKNVNDFMRVFAENMEKGLPYGSPFDFSGAQKVYSSTTCEFVAV